MTNQTELPDIDAWQQFQDRLRSAGHRRLVVLEGDREASRGWLRAVLPGLSVAPGVWVGTDDASAIDGITAIHAKNARRWLGQDLSCVVWDGWQGNPPDGLAALAGTLSAGGLFFWLMPPLANWSGFEDPDYRRLGLDGMGDHPFLARLARVLGKDSSVMRVQPGNPSAPLPSGPKPVEPPFRPGTTSEQTSLVERIVKTGLGRRRRPLVITADRGRGKSAALGMAAARLVAEGRQQVVVTANEPAAVETLLRHAEPAVGEGRVRYLSVDDLLEQRPEAEVIMVDEAAAVPPYRLRQILLGWPRVVFATTVHGYEGAGRGFSVRFRGVLDNETPHWKQASLQAPIRWAESDPLEPLISRMFLLDAEAPELPEHASGGEPQVVIERWYPADASDPELQQSFGLLVDAHYRTTPSDLRQWMDDPAAVSWRATIDGVVVGVLWATVEGGLDEGLAHQVMLGQRRVRGHLLPQSLASHSGFADAARQRLLRVVRIAVNASARRQGVGRSLVRAAQGHAEAQGLDGLGTSFGGNPELVTFWQGCGLMPVRLGLSREASSGELPLQMLSGTSEPGRQLVENLRRRLARHWLMLVPDNWRDLNPRLLLQLTASLPGVESLNEDDRRDLLSFAHGYRGFDLTLPVLRNLSMSDGVAAWLMLNAEAELWARAVLQGWEWSQLRRDGLCLGREEGEARLRALLEKLLQNRPEL
ncbi:tRNA(Met) cytidine acetyltransferase TmcA [Marinobacter confluentis]|uniref:tRNA(Met) cytidine acetyltransferase TmcA n=1 Tax=Marinobacter confluentis TaxID=1697557 RepID=A0A4Z1BH69_9GAMM|nr:GNAT family N-acetyltransferase [Marinobacter confluentis]TGN38819.1 tRNA(Met) cytidine acetyltransferase [Marinobacter confluentis]